MQGSRGRGVEVYLRRERAAALEQKSNLFDIKFPYINLSTFQLSKWVGSVRSHGHRASPYPATCQWLTSPLDSNEENYQRVYENDNFDENKASLGHEVLAGGAAFAGFKAFEDHQRSEGS
jgi:hypothetical protein